MAVKDKKKVANHTYGVTVAVEVTVNKEVEADSIESAVDKARGYVLNDIVEVQGELYENSSIDITSVWKA